MDFYLSVFLLKLRMLQFDYVRCSLWGGCVAVSSFCEAKLCLSKRCCISRCCSFYWHCFHLVTGWDFSVPFYNFIASSGSIPCAPSVSFHTDTAFLLAVISVIVLFAKIIWFCDCSKYTSLGIKSQSPILGWWPNSPLCFLLLLVCAAFSFCPNASFI